MNARLAVIGLGLAATLAADALAQSRDTPDPAKPPTIIVPPKPSPPPAPPAGVGKRDEPRAEFCCTPYGRFGPVGGSGRPGAPCQWTLPGSVTHGSTCN
jgi:hypothetical protein